MFSIGDAVSNTSHCWRIYFFHPQTFCLGVGSIIHTCRSMTRHYYYKCSLLTPTFTVLFVIAFSAFHGIRSGIFHPIHTGAAFSSPAFSTTTFLTVPRFPFSHFQSPPPDQAAGKLAGVVLYEKRERSRSICTSHTPSGKPDSVALHYTCPTPEVVHWASLRGRPHIALQYNTVYWIAATNVHAVIDL